MVDFRHVDRMRGGIPLAQGDKELPVAINVDELMAHIRQIVASRPTLQRSGMETDPLSTTPPARAGAGMTDHGLCRCDWRSLLASLDQVETLADIGLDVPQMTRLPTPLRQFARFLARGILFLSRFLTSQQTDCNHAVLSALRRISDRVRRLEQTQKDYLLGLDHALEHIPEGGSCPVLAPASAEQPSSLPREDHKR